MHFHIITVFPDSFSSYLNESMIKRGVSKKIIKISLYNLRDFTNSKHGKVDDKPYGGGPGMVLSAQPILSAVKKIKSKIRNGKVKTLIMSPRGKSFSNVIAKKLSRSIDHLIIISGRYEGIDARVKKALKAEEVSIGDYILTGGELPAMVILDSVSRQIPGFLGKFESVEETRATSGEVYTRPPELKFDGKNYKVPKVLRSGNHREIEEYRGKKKGE